MKILLAADDSPFTMKALAFITSHEELAKGAELVVLNVQLQVPPGVTGMVGSQQVTGYHREEAEKVLEPIKQYLGGYTLPFRTLWVAGHPADEIVRAAKAEKADLIVMGTQGSGMIARLVMGSVSQRVVGQSEVPVLLVK